MQHLTPQLISLATDAINHHLFPACVIGVIDRKGDRLVLPFGRQTYEVDSPTITEDSVFDVASVTKSIPTSCLTLQLIESGKLSLTNKLIDYVPDFRPEGGEAVLIQHLLTQTLHQDLTLSQLKDFSPEDILNSIYTSPLLSEPGSRYHYVNSTSILLGQVVESVSGNSLSQLAQDCLFDPLQMNHTTFHPKQLDQAQVVPTEIDDWRQRQVRGEIHDESAFVLQQIMTPGSAGIFTTTPDLLIFLEMLLNQGELDSQQYFKSTTIEDMYTNNVESIGQQSGLGWELNQPWMGTLRSESTFGKTGFTGCAVIVNPDLQTGLTILSNYTYPQRKSSKSARDDFFSRVADQVWLDHTP